MEVSTFEILYKPLTPPLGPGTSGIARRVLQGYFLTLTNLESADYRYGITFRITLPNPDQPERRLDGNALFISDVGGLPDNVFQTSLFRSGNAYSTSFTVGAGKTALVVLLPNLTLPNFFTAVPSTVEIRGFVSLRLPCVFQFGKRPIFRPQSDAPVRVLLNAEQRSTYLPNGWPGSMDEELDFDQTATSVALATGRALNQVPPETNCFLVAAPFPGLALDVLRPRLAVPRPLLDAEEGAAELLRVLAQLPPDSESLRNISNLLDEAGVPIRLEPAGGKTKRGG